MKVEAASILDVQGARKPCEQLRVLMVHERFAPDFGGGGERVVLAIARNLIEAGVFVQILTTGDPKITSFEGVPTARLPISRYRFNLAISSVMRFAKSADLIQTFNYHACLPSLMAARWVQRPVVCTFLGMIQRAWIEMRGPVVGRACMYWERVLLSRHFSQTLFLSEDNRDQALKLCGSSDRFAVIPPGIDCNEFSSDPEKQNIVVFVGKFDTRKGVYDVLNVACALPQIPFVMIGWGALADSLRSIASSNVSFHPIEDRDGLRRWLACASIFFLPSVGEGYPVALLEAMASGCAIVSTVPVPFEGERVVPGDRNSMINAIRTLWECPAKARRAGKINTERAKQCSWHGHVAKLISIYRAVLADSINSEKAR